MQWRNRKQAAVLLLMAAGSTCIAADIDNALDKGVQRAKTAQQSQARIESIDNATRDKEREFRAVTKENDGLQVYIEQLNKQLAMQQQELNDIENSIRQVTLIERQITPLMLRMIDSIEGFVQADLPFQKDERMARVENLKNLMGRSDVTVAEKYRKVMEAYQKEMDYGRTIRSYRATLSNNGSEREVDFLRVGRIALMYQSLDGQEIGAWDSSSQSWQALDTAYKSKLTMALRIAREQAAPDLIKVPVAAPEPSVQEH